MKSRILVNKYSFIFILFYFMLSWYSNKFDIHHRQNEVIFLDYMDVKHCAHQFIPQTTTKVSLEWNINKLYAEISNANAKPISQADEKSSANHTYIYIKFGQIVKYGILSLSRLCYGGDMILFSNRHSKPLAKHFHDAPERRGKRLNNNAPKKNTKFEIDSSNSQLYSV